MQILGSIRRSIENKAQAVKTLATKNGVEVEDCLEPLSGSNNSGSSPIEGLLTIIIYLAVGVIVYSTGVVGAEMHPIDALFFCVITFTTVGYGAPSGFLEESGAMIFTAFYMLIGVIVITSILGDLAETAFESRLATVEKNKQAEEEEFEATILSQGGRDTLTNQQLEELTAKNEILREARESKQIFIRQIAIAFAPIVIFFLLALSLYDYGEDDNGESNVSNEAVAAFYFTITSITTVGFGDVMPCIPLKRSEYNKADGCDEQFGEKIWICILLPIVVVTLAAIVGKMAIYKADKKLAEAQLHVLDKGLTEEHLKELDDDGNGQVTMMEFVEFMLISMGKVDKKTVKNLKHQFEALDADDSGYLTLNDLREYYNERNAQLESKRSMKSFR